MRLLLVDDEEELVSTLAERLEMRGIDVSWAAECETALDLVKKEAFDIALLDVRLPKMNGLELKRMMERLRPDMKFIFLTGHGSEEDFRACSKESGRDFYLIKPIRIETLLAKLQEILENKEQA